MRDDVLVLLSTSIAISIPQDAVAFELLHIDFIKGFKRTYSETCARRKREGKQGQPIVLDEMIKYTIDTLAQKCPDSQALYTLTSAPVMTEIKRRFMASSLPEMITTLAKRDLVKHTIRTFLHGKDKHNNHAQIDSTRFDGVFADFIAYFKENSSGTFRFDGSFEEFMCHCFVHFFYLNKKQDIWRELRAVDHAKREAETSIGAVKMLTQTRQDNVHIGEFLRNIVVLNDRMFYHSGQSLEVKGVCYDVYYLILNYLCKQRVAQINETLAAEGVGDYTVQFVDELNRKETRTVSKLVDGIPTRMVIDANKSIASKINNAWELVPYLFECVRSGGWSFDNIVELRDQCFLLGKKDMEGKNCIWKNVSKGAETARYFDMPNASSNYAAYDILLKGVLSVLSLMQALENRGMYLVDTYPTISRVVEDKMTAMFVEYIEDLDYIDRIKSLQAKAQAYPRTNAELLQFTEMVHEYAGSEQNNHANIRENRYEALVFGLLDNPKLKQKGQFQTEYETLKSVAEYFTSIPRSYDEYVYKVYADNALTFRFGAPGMFVPDYVLVQQYSTPYYNRFFTDSPEMANYYLYKIGEHQKPGDPPPPKLDPMSWRLCNTLVPYVHVTQVVTARGDETYDHYYALYVPIMREFLLIPLSDGVGYKVHSRSMSELQGMIVDSCYNGRQNISMDLQISQIPRDVFVSLMPKTRNGTVELDTALANSIGFDTLMGISNLDSPSVASKLARIKIEDRYIPVVKDYYSWLCDLTKLQNSFVELLQLMLTFALYCSKSISERVQPGEDIEGLRLFHSLLRSEFYEENLNWFFNALQDAVARGRMDKLDYTWGKNLPQPGEVDFTEPDMYILDILTGKVGLKDVPKHGLLAHFIKSLETGKSLPEKFVYAYNYLACKFSFLRVLRDSYDLVLNVVGGNVSTLGCELDARFHIRDVLQSARAGVGTGGMLDNKCALLDTLSIEQVTRFVGLARIHNWQTFSSLCEGLIHYIDSCHTDISALVDFEIEVAQETKSKFSQWGGMFEATGPYNHPVVMSNLGLVRARARKDDAGFLLLKNSYLHAQLGKAAYYVHSTGRVLMVEGEAVTPMMFNFDQPDDVKLYGDIVTDAKRRCSWQ